jgi:carbonic anhydrase
VVPNLILDAEPGELFEVRQIAAIVPAPERPASRPLAAALEYAIDELHVADVIVCGHDRCGGLAALLNGGASAESELAGWLDEASIDEALRGALRSLPPSRAVETFTKRQLDTLARYPVVARALGEGRVTLHTWIYDVEDGRVRACTEDGTFRATVGDRPRRRARDHRRVRGRRVPRDSLQRE